MPPARHMILLVCALVAAAAPADPTAEQLYSKADYEGALSALERLPGRDAASWALKGKSHYGLGDFQAALDALEEAVQAEPGNSRYWNWLGRAYGRHAESGNMLLGVGRAKKCREAFEKAVEVDPENLDALNDLFAFYLDAPGFLGGGEEKAAGIATRIGQFDRAEQEYAKAEIARKKKDAAAAEAHYRSAMELEPERVGRVLALARFLAKQGRWLESEALFGRADHVAPNSPKTLFHRAKAYLDAGRNRDEAIRLLTRYLDAELTPDDPPRHEARKLLRKANGE